MNQRFTHIFYRIKDVLQLLCDRGRAKNAFLNYHLVRRKYILSHACEHFDKNPLEPAPLLNHSLLHIGCGDSKLAEEMTFRGADVTVVDIGQDIIDNALKRAESTGAMVEFILGSPEKLIQEKRVFDIILCMDLFENVEHTSGFIKQIDQLLTEDGILIFSTNNRSISSFIWHIVFAQWVFKWVPKGTYNFKRFRPPHRLVEKLIDKGFVMEDLCGVYLDTTENRWKRKTQVGARYLGAAKRKK